MNVIKVNVNFKNRTIYKQGVDLTSGDYNSTKLVFEFDRQDGRKVFEMKDPDGEIVLWSEIENNEITLVGKDEEGNNASLFKEAGKYIFEISLYDGESKLTSAFDYIPVKEEQVKDGDKIVTAYLPIFDKLLNEVSNALKETTTQSTYAQEQGDYAKEQGDYAKEEAIKVDEVVDYVVRTSEEANDKSDTAISISKGANQALSYLTYPDMITNFNAFDKNKFEKSQSVMIKQLNIPDMWIYDLSDEYVEYTYTTDEAVINALMSDAGFHVGYYILGPLETQKVDLTDYVKNTDYATSSKGGTIKVYSNYGTSIISNGIMGCTTKTYDAYKILSNYLFISKGTLENVLKERFVTLTQTEYDALLKAGSINEETEYNIVEE